MAITNGYTTLELVKARLDITGSGQDASIEQQIEAASRWVDDYCGRTFYQETGVVKTFTADDPLWLPVRDLVSVSALVTDNDGDRTYETTWATTDYDLDPQDADDRGFPYTQVTGAPGGDYTFPVGVARGVKITGTWGWPSVPKPIAEATALLAIRFRKRVDAPFGIAGSADLGMLQNIPRTDPDVAALVAPFRRMEVLAF